MVKPAPLSNSQGGVGLGRRRSSCEKLVDFLLEVNSEGSHKLVFTSCTSRGLDTEPGCQHLSIQEQGQGELNCQERLPVSPDTGVRHGLDTSQAAPAGGGG